MEVIPLYDDVYAVKFPYHMVTEMTLSMALPTSFRRETMRNRMTIKFAAESETEAGTKRADCSEIAKCFPAEVAILGGQVENLKDYVIFKVV